MPSLPKELRRLLEKTIAGVNGARQIAELGAEQSLRRLAVDRHEPHTSLTPEERSLRTQLRAHGRQLGDKRDLQRGSQSIDHLKQAVAYEHWHRLLFARFLAENDLLMHPEHGVALSLDEVKELALGLQRDWIDVAAEYAQRMLLREVFRSDDPALSVPLAPERRAELEKTLDSLPREVFLAEDSLGWVYQFWQDDAKKQVDVELQAGEKADANRIPAKTQLFTEDYIVLFLLENTLGAWWTAKNGASELPGYTWTYLSLNDDGSPRAGGVELWPKNARDLRLLDPCMGSGHFLTFALPILARIRQAEESLTLVDAITAVLHDNLYGLELDPRCSQIAAFNLALTAWKLEGRHFELPSLNLACSGLAIDAKLEAWVTLAGANGRKQELMSWLYDLFDNAPTLGSLINPKQFGLPLVDKEVAELMPLLEEALESGVKSTDDRELAITAQGVVASARILAATYHLVITNVPYLKSGNQSPVLKAFCSQHYGAGKADLATSFLERCLALCCAGGTTALVSPQNWLYQPGYIHLRRKLLSDYKWNFLIELGPHAFDTISGEVVKVCLTSITNLPMGKDHTFAGIDVSAYSDASSKGAALRQNVLTSATQSGQLTNPECRIVIGDQVQGTLLSAFANSYKGITTNDDPRFVRFFWELPTIENGWEFHQSTVVQTTLFGGMERVLLYESGKGSLRAFAKAQDRDRRRDLQGVHAWGKWGVAVSCTGPLAVSLYTGGKFDTNVAAIIPHRVEDLPAIYEFCRSPEFARQVRRIDRALKVTNATLVKIPYDHDHWAQVASETAREISCPDSTNPSQWLFNGNIATATEPLQVALAKLLGYSWPRQQGVTLLGCSAVDDSGLEDPSEFEGIVCLASIAGSEGAARQLRDLLQEELGNGYDISRLLQEKKSGSLEDWLRDEFFEEHCQLFGNRPFLWHIWDGRKDGFHAFVNYHKLDGKNLEKLIYSYLGDWIARRRQDVTNGMEGADARLVAAEHLQDELKKIHRGEKPYDIFVRWKSIDRQPIGWEPDLNDGVRTNIRPWLAQAKLHRATKTGIFRYSPGIKFTKNDPGKEPVNNAVEFPWFTTSRDRIIDHHLTLDEKRSTRGAR
jgi:hypothetical protein